MEEIFSKSSSFYQVLIRNLSDEQLNKLNKKRKLSLQKCDMIAIRDYFKKLGREPSNVEIETIAQTWSEHCKHRIFAAKIKHTDKYGKTTIIDSIFKTFIKKPSEKILQTKQDFVLSAFVDNAGFIKISDELAACFKVETHNHPSAISPYAGAHTGIGGVIRDILGAGKGAHPIASIDVFCVGTLQNNFKYLDAGAIHPIETLRELTRGVSDYGNRMGIPTVGGAVNFDVKYTRCPLVFCGTAGVIPIKDIEKKVTPGDILLSVGGKTGRDGLKGATFSSASLHSKSYEQDMSAVQIGNPIEEKKLADFIVEARKLTLIKDITDCGAGGYSSAVGELLEQTGGELYLDKISLKEKNMSSWEIFLSESQERMVLAVDKNKIPTIKKLADLFETVITEIGKATQSKHLRVFHGGDLVCELSCDFLHKKLPKLHLKSKTQNKFCDFGKFLATNKKSKQKSAAIKKKSALFAENNANFRKTFSKFVIELLSSHYICSREPIIRQYDCDVQGNTFLRPLAGAENDCPQDAAVLANLTWQESTSQESTSQESTSQEKVLPNLFLALSCALLPQWGKFNAYRMGAAVVDEAVRSVICVGANPEKIALLDNFCLGDPYNEGELGSLVDAAKGMSEAARIFSTPFISGKDSFHNTFQTTDGKKNSVPCTLLISAIAQVELADHILSSTIKSGNSSLYLLGKLGYEQGGSQFLRLVKENYPNDILCDKIVGEVPLTNCERNFKNYQDFYKAVCAGIILSAHDISEGGLITTLAEMSFSMCAGLQIANLDPYLFLSETPGCIVFEVLKSNENKLEKYFSKKQIKRLGETNNKDKKLRVFTNNNDVIFDEKIIDLKAKWQNGLKAYL